MSINAGGYSRNLKVHLENDPKIRGLKEFKNRLERDFFAEVQVRNRIANNDQVNLIIDLNCNFELKENIQFFKNNNWDNSHKECCGIDISNLSKALSDLKLQNRLEIDIEEFSLFLLDTSIIIKKIYKESIPQQLGELLCTITEHYRYITKNLTETPYEIYIPVFEEDLQENHIRIARIEQAHNDKKDYFGYWGLYFDSEEDAAIYDLPKKRIITGELHMLNH